MDGVCLVGGRVGWGLYGWRGGRVGSDSVFPAVMPEPMDDVAHGMIGGGGVDSGVGWALTVYSIRCPPRPKSRVERLKTKWNLC